ncbi:MAG TPA: TlpA disulfide reductase family protein [Candidatus Polarisedimenticolaceae bacterium]|nr:TlpA disulfide reductase family protein [Candidatus Polarisedimenticolaceae bacterium]
MRLPWVLCLAALLPAAPRAATLTGVGPAGTPAWSRALQADGPRTPLQGLRWAPPLPDLSIPLLDGGVFRTSDQRGKVLLLDVWASWCAPCKVELPRLQALAAEEGARGLVAVAVNAQEPEAVAKKAAAALQLTLPVGLYDGTLDEVLGVRSLPAVFLVDRQGRLRARWDGYRQGLEDEIHARVRALLREGPDGTPEKVGEVQVDAAALGVRLWRDLPASASGIASVPRSHGGDQVILRAGRGLLAVDPDGTLNEGPPVSLQGARLQAADVNGIGAPEMLLWRRAGSEVVVLDLAGGTPRTLRSPAPVLDVAVLPGGRVVLATTENLVAIDRLGALEPLAGSGPASGLAVRGTELFAIDVSGVHRLRRYGLEGDHVVPRDTAPAEGWPRDAFALAAAGPGFVVAPVEVDLTAGSFTGPGRDEVAVRYGRSDLAVLDAGTGEVRFAARLDGEVAQVAAADLDGDGVDELAVAAGGDLLVLGTAVTETRAAD